MSDPDSKYFDILKTEVSKTLRNVEPGIPESISEWKGNDIIIFQNDLEQKEKGRISEKWFYTHLKTNREKLPRIDMLDLLSKYVGFSGWNDFKSAHTDKIIGNQPERTKKRRNKPLLYLSGLFIIIILFIFTSLLTPVKYNFCFIDSDLNTPILNSSIQIILLYPGESPVYTKTNESGCFLLKTNKKEISFVVKAPYYKTDTITRVLNKKINKEHVHLNTNDYAIMIHYFSNSNIRDWRKRRRQLDNMFADNAQIYQVFRKKNTGMEIYNKQEFINKLTMPVSSLNNIEVLETIYTGQKISILRFYQKSKDIN